MSYAGAPLVDADDPGHTSESNPTYMENHQLPTTNVGDFSDLSDLSDLDDDYELFEDSSAGSQTSPEESLTRPTTQGTQSQQDIVIHRHAFFVNIKFSKPIELKNLFDTVQPRYGVSPADKLIIDWFPFLTYEKAQRVKELPRYAISGLNEALWQFTGWDISGYTLGKDLLERALIVTMEEVEQNNKMKKNATPKFYYVETQTDPYYVPEVDNTNRPVNPNYPVLRLKEPVPGKRIRYSLMKASDLRYLKLIRIRPHPSCFSIGQEHESLEKKIRDMVLYGKNEEDALFGVKDSVIRVLFNTVYNVDMAYNDLINLTEDPFAMPKTYSFLARDKATGEHVLPLPGLGILTDS